MTFFFFFSNPNLNFNQTLTVGGDGLAFFDNGSSSSDSFSPLLSSFSGFVEAAARFERCGVVLLFALFFVGAFRLGDSCLIYQMVSDMFLFIYDYGFSQIRNVPKKCLERKKERKNKC